MIPTSLEINQPNTLFFDTIGSLIYILWEFRFRDCFYIWVITESSWWKNFTQTLKRSIGIGKPFLLP